MLSSSSTAPAPLRLRTSLHAPALPFLLLALICLLLRFLFFRYAFPDVNVDEASFFSPAFDLAKHGGLASPVHGSFLPGACIYTYWMPPFYLVLLGGWLKLFGATLLMAKLLSGVLALAAAFVLYRVAGGGRSGLWIAALLLICPFVLVSSAFVRMEALGLLLVALSMIAVQRNASPLLKGILAALCVMTHPVLLACATALGLATMPRGWKPFLIFCAAALIVVSPYLYYILQDRSVFGAQMALQLARKANARLSNLQAAYLLQSVPLALAACWWLWQSDGSRELKTFLGAGLGLTLVIVLKSNEFNYQVYTIPYVLGCLALVLRRPEAVHRTFSPLLVYVFFAVLLFAKLNKYHFATDDNYRSLVTYLRQHPSWKGRHIYVGGNPDVASYFIQEGEDVERAIPIATGRAGIGDRFDYVVEVVGRDEVLADTIAKPWLRWPARSDFSPASAPYTLHVFIR